MQRQFKSLRRGGREDCWALKSKRAKSARSAAPALKSRRQKAPSKSFRKKLRAFLALSCCGESFLRGLFLLPGAPPILGGTPAKGAARKALPFPIFSAAFFVPPQTVFKNSKILKKEKAQKIKQPLLAADKAAFAPKRRAKKPLIHAQKSCFKKIFLKCRQTISRVLSLGRLSISTVHYCTAPATFQGTPDKRIALFSVASDRVYRPPMLPWGVVSFYLAFPPLPQPAVLKKHSQKTEDPF